jgi:hypothetical protein
MRIFVSHFYFVKKNKIIYIKIKKDTQEWKPPKCLISALLSFVAGPGIEPGTS